MDNQPPSTSDSHHTMEELYEHRHALFLALVKIYDNYITPLNTNVQCWKTKKHDDGTMYEGWFLLGMTCIKKSFIAGADPEITYISYHLPMKYWHMARVIELDKGPEWDGYTSEDVIKRLLAL